MFRFEPAEMCVHHTSQIHALQALRMRRNQKAKTEAARNAVIEALSGVQALSAAPATPTAEQQASPKAAPAQQAGEAAESVPAVEREQERIAFKDAHRHLELYEVPDAWGRPMFKHSHVEASWLGWIVRASLGQAPAEPEGISREDWIEQAVRVYLIAGDTDEQAQECAAYLWGELDMDDLADPYDAAMSDIEGRNMPRKETQ